MASTISTEQKNKGDQWAIAINTVPVNREEIVSGFFKENGIFQDNAMMAGLLESLLPILSNFLDNDAISGLFDALSTQLYGGAANHTFLTIHRLDKDGNLIQPAEEILQGQGMKTGPDGKPVLGSGGLLIPSAFDKTNAQTDLMYEALKNQTTSSTIVLQADKDTIYQGYSVMLDATHQLFAKDTVQYVLKDGEEGQHCNSTVGQLLSALKSVKGGALYTEDVQKLGAGMHGREFNGAAQDVTLTGEALMARVQDQKNNIQAIRQSHMDAITQTAGLNQDRAPIFEITATQ